MWKFCNPTKIVNSIYTLEYTLLHERFPEKCQNGYGKLLNMLYRFSEKSELEGRRTKHPPKKTKTSFFISYPQKGGNSGIIAQLD